MRIRSTAAAVGLLLTTAVLPAAAEVPPQDAAYASELTGAAEVPAVDTTAAGYATVGHDADGGTLDVAVAGFDLDEVTQAHLHNAAPGENGPVVVSLLDLVDGGLTLDYDGGIARMTITDDEVLAAGDVDGTVASLVAALDAGEVYVNVHTVANPAGELRGDLTAIDVADGFTDDDGTNFENSLDVLAAQGIYVGLDDGSSGYAGRLTRAQLAALMSRALNLPPGGDVPFPDAAGSPFADDIAAAAAAGLVVGDAEGDFNGAQRVTRGQMARIIANAYSIFDIPMQPQFGDVDFVDGVFGRQIEALAHAGVVSGFSDSEFRPGADVRRGQVSSFIARAQGTVATDTNDLDDLFDLTVLHNNDGESALTPDEDGNGPASFVTLVDAARATADVRTSGDVFVSSGDNFLAGTAITASNEDGVQYDAIVLERLGYDAVQLGNHDFDFGPQYLSDFLDSYGTTPQYLAANIDATGTPLADEVAAGTIDGSTTVTVDGREVGIVGAITEELASISQPEDVVVDDVVASTQAEIDALQTAGVDIIVFISHLQGVDADLAVIPQLSGVDIAVAGGGDEDLTNPGEAPTEDSFGPYPLLATNAGGSLVPVVTTTGSYGELGRLVGGFDAGGDLTVVRGESALLANTGYTPDATIVTQVEEPVEAFEAALAATVIATSEVGLNGVREDVRTRETNLGDLLADGILATAVAETEAGDPPPVVAFTNGGGIRNDDVRGPGDISRLDTFAIAPFDNYVVTDTITHAELLAVLEHAVSAVEFTGGRFAQVSGLSFDYDPTAAAGSRVRTVTLDDSTVVVENFEATTPAATITVATINFLANGGDDYPLDGTFTRLDSTYQQALEAIITDLGTITAADYPEGGEGRITASAVL